MIKSQIKKIQVNHSKLYEAYKVRYKIR